MIALGAMMTLSMSDIAIDRKRVRIDFMRGLWPLIMSFGILTPVFMLVSFFFEGDFKIGWILAAAMPAGVMIVPYSTILKADVRLALYGELAIYLLAFIIAPAIAILALGTGIDIGGLLWVLLMLILLPLAFSRMVKMAKPSERTKELTMNLVVLFFFMIVIGANREIFLEEQEAILKLIIASSIALFGVGLTVDRILKRIEMPQRKTLTMFATIKNTGMAIAVCLALFPPQAAMPPTMLVIFEMIWMIFLISWKYNPERIKHKYTLRGINSLRKG